MDWTSPARQTDSNFVNENARDSIRRNTESDLIETDERDRRELKEKESRISAVRGMMIDVREK
jgi:hypothetical protein